MPLWRRVRKNASSLSSFAALIFVTFPRRFPRRPVFTLLPLRGISRSNATVLAWVLAIAVQVATSGGVGWTRTVDREPMCNSVTRVVASFRILFRS